MNPEKQEIQETKSKSQGQKTKWQQRGLKQSANKVQINENHKEQKTETLEKIMVENTAWHHREKWRKTDM